MPERTGRDNGATCLDPETLSAYIDGRLDARARAEVEAHLAACEDCYDVMSEVLHIQEALPAARPALSGPDAARDVVSAPVPRPGGDHVVRGAFGRRKAVWGAAGVVLAAAAALVLVVRLQPAWWTGGVDPKLADLVEAVGEERTVEARLTGGFKYGPLRSPVRSGGRVGPTDNWRLLAAAGRIREDAEKDPSAENLRALGVASLLVGDYSRAIQTLEGARPSGSRDARLLTDLSAAYLARASAQGVAEDIERGLSTAQDALAIEPELLEAQFNRALALEHLGRSAEALRAWEELRRRESSAGWSQEIDAHIQATSEQPPSGLEGLRR